MNKIIFGIITLTVVSIFALQIDDELHPRASKWIEEVRSKDASEAYLYLMGLFAKETESPIEAGSEIYQSIKDGQKRYILKQSKFYYSEYPMDNKLALPKGDLFCEFWKNECLKALFQNPSRNEQEIERHSVLLNRYHEFLDKDGYKTLSIPMITEPIPPFRYLTAGHRLHNLNAIAKASRGEVDSAVQTIYLNVSRIRANLVSQDQLIGKMVLLMMLSESLDVITVLFDKYQPKSMKKIGALSVDERDLEYPMARELGMAYDTYRNLDKNPEFWEEGGNIPGWIVRVLFKPNMSI
ncbi:MAG: hypothetical protein GXP10_04445, partial [Gammaproteobacteria bacterium]|nr:hypothetical protein [Gammaproteobacteria bacterium]